MTDFVTEMADFVLTDTNDAGDWAVSSHYHLIGRHRNIAQRHHEDFRIAVVAANPTMVAQTGRYQSLLLHPVHQRLTEFTIDTGAPTTLVSMATATELRLQLGKSISPLPRMLDHLMEHEAKMEVFCRDAVISIGFGHSWIPLKCKVPVDPLFRDCENLLGLGDLWNGRILCMSPNEFHLFEKLDRSML